MDERNLGGGAEGFSSPAGPANTPAFDRMDAGSGTTGTEGGRPPSHREFHEGAEGSGGSQGSSGGAQGIAEQAETRVNETMTRAADGLESAARQLDEVADRFAGQGASGVRASAGNMAHQVADAIESTAGYLRDNDVRKLQQDLERQVRQNPLQTLLIGVAAGWVIGKVLR
ncbi:hypothetical protein BH24GEM3_BH24GEM3_09890 [soil metagenome]